MLNLFTPYSMMLVVLIISIGTAAQLILKYATTHTYFPFTQITKRFPHFLKPFLNFWLCLGIFLFLLNAGITILALQSLPLTVILPATALIYATVPFGAHVVFHEQLHSHFWLGCLLIITGILVITAL